MNREVLKEILAKSIITIMVIVVATPIQCVFYKILENIMIWAAANITVTMLNAWPLFIAFVIVCFTAGLPTWSTLIVIRIIWSPD